MHVYRCNRCRTRNSFLKAVGAYVRKVPQCRHCRHTRFYIDKERISRPVCRCGGYHYVHRPRSPCCHLNPNYLANAMKRAGIEEQPCPF